MQTSHSRLVFVFLFGLMIGVIGFSPWFFGSFPSTTQAQQLPQAKPDLAALSAELERLKQVVPDQAHAMQDVDYHFTNLWFAGNQGNWDLRNSISVDSVAPAMGGANHSRPEG